MLVRRSFAVGSSSSFSSASSFSHGALCCLAPLLVESLGARRLLVQASVFPTAAAMADNEAENVQVGEAKDLNDQAAGAEKKSETKELGNLAVNIMPHILNLYCLRATAADFEIYSPNATFEDPLMKAIGVKQIKSAFYSMPKIFSEGNMGEYEVEEKEIAPGSGEILIDNLQHYKVWGKAMDMRSLIKLQVEDGKVISHQDLWDKNPLWTKDTVKAPLVGRAAQAFRRFNMIVTHTLMGFGKDPRPKN